MPKFQTLFLFERANIPILRRHHSHGLHHNEIKHIPSGVSIASDKRNGQVRFGFLPTYRRKKGIMDNPLIGKQLTWTWETHVPNSAFEVDFLSNLQNRSKGRGVAIGYDANHTYEPVIVTSNKYMISWLKKNDSSAVKLCSILTI